MASSFRKEFKLSTRPVQLIAELPELVSAPDHYYQALDDIQLDKLSLYFFYHSPFKQRFVVISTVIDGQFVVRWQPGYVESTTLKQLQAEKKFYTEAKQDIEKFFVTDKKIDIDLVHFSVSMVNTPGVVHHQLMGRLEKKEYKLFLEMKRHSPIGSSFFKYQQDADTIAVIWTNRSGLNKDAFIFDDLAVGCYAFEEDRDFTKEDPYRAGKREDWHYHLTRSIPLNFYVKMIAAVNQKMAADDVIKAKYPNIAFTHDQCYNELYENKWNQIRKLYQTNRPEAIAKIQHLLIRNLYLHYLHYGATGYNYIETHQVLLAALKKAEEYGISINFNYIPPEFKTTKTIEEIAIHESRNKKDSLRDYIYETRMRTRAEKKKTSKLFTREDKPLREGLTDLQIMLLRNLALSYDSRDQKIGNLTIDRIVGVDGDVFLRQVCKIIHTALHAKDEYIQQLGDKARKLILFAASEGRNFELKRRIEKLAVDEPVLSKEVFVASAGHLNGKPGRFNKA